MCMYFICREVYLTFNESSFVEGTADPSKEFPLKRVTHKPVKSATNICPNFSIFSFWMISQLCSVSGLGDGQIITQARCHEGTFSRVLPLSSSWQLYAMATTTIIRSSCSSTYNNALFHSSCKKNRVNLRQDKKGNLLRVAFRNGLPDMKFIRWSDQTWRSATLLLPAE